MLKTTLTACRVASRLGLAPLTLASIAVNTVCSVQMRKMQSAMPKTVLSVRSQLRRRCANT
jgi:hypothetical protein